MRAVSSLSNRIFLACAVLAILSLGFAFSFVNARAVAEAEVELRAELVDAATLVHEHRTFLTDTFTRMARLVADLPKLKSAVDTGDAPTVQPLAADYRQIVNADLLVVSDPHGRVLGEAGAEHPALPLAPGSAEEVSLFLPDRRGILQIVSVPILLGIDSAELLGRLTVGFFLDDQLASRFKALTASEIAFAADGRIVASSLPPGVREPLRPLIDANGVSSVRLGNEEYLVLGRAMPRSDAGTVTPAARPVVLILRSRTERLSFLNTLRTGLTSALVLTVLLATILSYAVARTMTRPLAAVTGAMREVAATGDLTRKVAVRSRAWDDEDARLLASTFNTLTESIARFQGEAAQRERLSSLGRLSTVVAHEIRNPLMIIRATLATLRREPIAAAELREAVADIDEETTRLNRLVTEVLDFARPMRFELAPASANDVCRASAAAVWADAGGAGTMLDLDLDPDVPPIVTDGERLRTALVNILTNARYAIQAGEPADTPGAATHRMAGGRPPAAVLDGGGIVVRTRAEGDRVIVTVRDRGRGISPEDMAHIFDPYFTTRRAGTGLGLPIAKNIIEGLGGRLTARSETGRGTEIRIELPLRSAAS